jgi:hypothetical protein
MNKKIEVKNDNKVEVKVDFQLVWSFIWRAYVILFGIGFTIGILATMFSL